MREQVLSYLQSKGWKYTLSPDGNWARLDTCPICNKKARRPFAINTKEGTAHCFHGDCGWSGGLTLLKQHFGDLVFKVRNDNSKGSVAPAESLINELQKRLWDSSGVLERFKKFRCLTDKTIKEFRLGLDDKHGVAYPSFQHGKPVSIKYKRRAKDGDKICLAWRGPNKESAQTVLFNGHNLRGNDICYLVEGEDDCMVLHQLGYKNVVSIPHGSSTTRGDWLNPLESFHDIIIIMDSDPAGAKASAQLAETIGKTKCRIVGLPDDIKVPPGPWGTEEFEAKDITDFVRAGAIDKLKYAIEHAPIQRHQSIIHISDHLDKFLFDFVNGDRTRGLTTGWPSIDALIGGRRPGELTIVSGSTSAGKSKLALGLAMNVARLGEPCLMSAFEQGIDALVTQMTSWVTGKTAYVGSSNEMKLVDAERAVSILQDMPIYLVNVYGRMPTEEYVDCMAYAKRRLMVTTSILDHLHYTLRVSDPDKERHAIDQAMLSIKQATINLGMYQVVVVHPSQRKGEDNPVLRMTDLRGSSFISQVADNVWIVWRDLELQKLKPGFGRAVIHVLKNRSEKGTIGKIEMAFDMNSLKFIDQIGNELDFVSEQEHTESPVEQNEFI